MKGGGGVGRKWRPWRVAVARGRSAAARGGVAALVVAWREVGDGGRQCRGGRWRPAAGGAGEALKPSIPHALSPSPDAPRPRPSLTRDGGVDVWELGREGRVSVPQCLCCTHNRLGFLMGQTC